MACGEFSVDGRRAGLRRFGFHENVLLCRDGNVGRSRRHEETCPH